MFFYNRSLTIMEKDSSEIVLTCLKAPPDKPRRFVVVFSIFRMEKAYRRFEKYFDGLKKIISYSNLSMCDICIFIDDSVLTYQPFKKWLDKEVIKMTHVFIIHYEHPNFKKSIYHFGTFGSIMRLYALTNGFKPKYEAVYLSDVDMEPYEVDQRHILRMLKQKADISYESRVYYNKKWAPSTLKFPVLLGTLISSVYFPLSILTNFLNELKKKKFNKIIREIIEDEKTSIIKHTTNEEFIYGMDEYFMNHFVLPYYKNKISLVRINPLINSLPYIFNNFVASNKFSSKELILTKSYKTLNSNTYKKKLLQYYFEIYEYCIKNNFENVLEIKDKICFAYELIKHIKPDLHTYLIAPVKLFDTTTYKQLMNYVI